VLFVTLVEIVGAQVGILRVVAQQVIGDGQDGVTDRNDRFLLAASGYEAVVLRREVTVQRYTNYQRLLGKNNIEVPIEGAVANLENATLQLAPPGAGGGDTEGLALIAAEAGHLGWLNDANNFSLSAGGVNALAGVLHMIPDFAVGITWPVTAQTHYGGTHFGSAASAFAAVLGMAATNASFQAGRGATMAGHQRRVDEWRFQSNMAAKELAQIDKQIIASDIRVQVAEHEITTHDQQMDNAQQVDELMRDKFTNQQLYSWMVGQISNVYFRTYQLAYDLAKRAERTYRFELGLKESSFIQFGYWDSLKKGLLCGEGLYLALKRMDSAYLAQNAREFEITKHISLLQLDPMALLDLKETGTCDVSIPEVLFDMEFPGHYLRRIKSMALSISCVAGPYSSVPCTLTLVRYSIRRSSSAAGRYARDFESDDARFTDSFGATHSIVTSNAQNDSGQFEMNLRDERYLHFEGAGAISTWRLELPMHFKSFDYETISDVVLHMRYTARGGGEPLKQQATAELANAVNAVVRSAGVQGQARGFSLRREFPSEWQRFLNPGIKDPVVQTLEMSLAKERFPFLFQGRTVTIGAIELFVKVRAGFAGTHNEKTVNLALAPGSAPLKPLRPLKADMLTLGLLDELPHGTRAFNPPEGAGMFTLCACLGTGTELLDPRAIDDILVICHYALH
jgi:hypothetical protein